MLEAYYSHKMNQERNEGEATQFQWEEEMEKAIKDAQEHQEFESIEWGKSSPEESDVVIANAVSFYRAENPNIKHILGAEVKVVEPIEDMDGNPLPIPIKCFIDLAYKTKEGIVLEDHKIVGGQSIKKQEDLAPAFDLQAAVNFFAAWKEFGEKPRKMIFRQVKKDKNSHPALKGDLQEALDNAGIAYDKGAKKDELLEMCLENELVEPVPPQITPYVIDFEQRPEVLAQFIELYSRMVKEISGQPLYDEATGVMQFLPNPFAQFGGDDAWLDFCDEVSGNKTWNFQEIKADRERRMGSSEEALALLDEIEL